jgi:hypothetical protein
MRTLKEEIVRLDEFESPEEPPACSPRRLPVLQQDYSHSMFRGLSPIDFEHSLNQRVAAAWLKCSTFSTDKMS